MSSGTTQLKWVDFKALVIARTLALQWRQVKQVYQLVAFDGAFRTECVIRIDDPAGVDQLDFETNFKNAPVKPVQQRDTDGAPLARQKVTLSGRSYNERSITFTTATVGSAESKKLSGADWGDVTLKFYRANGTEITTGQGDVTAECVLTRLDWEPLYTYDLLAGALTVDSVPIGYGSTAKLWVTAVPDLPAIYGGSVNFIDGRVLRLNQTIIADGRSAKELPYSAVYHTNKIRAVIKHAVGNFLALELVLQHYYDKSIV